MLSALFPIQNNCNVTDYKQQLFCKDDCSKHIIAKSANLFIHTQCVGIKLTFSILELLPRKLLEFDMAAPKAEEISSLATAEYIAE